MSKSLPIKNSSLAKIALFTLIRKEIIRFTRIWTQTLLPSVITMTLYFLIFGSFIGSQLSDIKGITYIEFIVPGLIMMAIITNSYGNVVASFFGAKFGQSIEELLVSPTPDYIIIIGFCSGGILRGLMVGSLVTIVASFFVDLVFYSIPLIIVFSILTAFLFSLMGLTNAIFAKKFDDVNIIPTFVLTPLTYLGGVFYSISLLPDFWEGASFLNPILYMVNGIRYGFWGVSDVGFQYGLIFLVVFIGMVFSLNMMLLRKGIGLRS